MVIDVVLATIAVVLVLDSLVVLVFPRWALGLLRKMVRGGASGLRKIGIVEFLIGIALLAVAIFLRAS